MTIQIKTGILVTIFFITLFCAGVYLLTLLSTPGDFGAQKVYIDENGLLAGQARPDHHNQRMVEDIHALLQICYSSTPSTPLLQLTFAHCLSGIAQSLGFHTKLESQTMLTLHHEAPRSGGAESITFAATLHPHEFSPSVSSLAVVMSSVIVASRAGYLSRDVVIFVAMPTPLLHNPYSAESKFMPTTNTPAQTIKDANALIQKHPYQAYMQWHQQYLDQFTTHLKYSPFPYFAPALPFGSVGLDFLPFVSNQQLTIQSTYPRGAQANLDLASTLISAMDHAGTKLTIQEPSFPRQSLPEIAQFTTTQLSHQHPPLSLEQHISKTYTDTLYSNILAPLASYITMLPVKLTNEDYGLRNYLMAQYRAHNGQFLHSAFGDSFIDAITLSSQHSVDSQRYSRSLSAALSGVTTPVGSDQIELRTTPKPSQQQSSYSLSTLTQHSTGLELWLRTFSNAHERLHHSLGLYALITIRTFVRMERYTIPFLLLWAAMPFMALFTFCVQKNVNSAAKKTEKTSTSPPTTTQPTHTAQPTPFEELLYGAFAILSSLCMGFVPSLVSTLLTHVAVPLNPQLDTFFVSCGLLLMTFFIYTNIIKRISQHLSTPAWLLTVSLPVLPLLIMNFAHAVVLLLFTIPLLLLHFSPLTLVESGALRAKHRICGLLFKFISLLIFSPFSWYIVDLLINYYSSSTIPPNCLLTKPSQLSSEGIFMGWSSCPTSSQSLSAAFSLFKFFNPLPHQPSVETTQVVFPSIQSITFWAVYVPTYFICFFKMFSIAK